MTRTPQKRLCALCALLMLIAALPLGPALAETGAVAQEGENILSYEDLLSISAQMMQDTFGFTNEMLNYFFIPSEQKMETLEAEEVWQVKLEPASFAEALGVYQLTIIYDDQDEAGNVRVDALWSKQFEDTTGVDTDDWDAPTWGPGQLQRILDVEAEYMEAYQALAEEKGDQETWSLEEKASVDSIILDSGYPGQEDVLFNQLPTETDLQEAEARQRAMAAVLEKFGIAPAELAEYTEHLSFQARHDGSGAMWTFIYDGGEDIEILGRYTVVLSSPEGRVMSCAWRIDDFFAQVDRLMEQGKYDAIFERVTSNAGFSALPAEKQAEIQAFLTDAGYTYAVSPAPIGPEAPEKEPLSEGDIITTAKGTLRSLYGFTLDTLTFFDVEARTYPGQADEEIWLVVFSPAEYPEKLGTYQVEIAAGSGVVLSAAWSLEDVEGGVKAVTETGWAAADVWGAPQLDRYLVLKAQLQSVETQVEMDGGEWSLKTSAAYDTLMREAGFDAETWYHGLPAETDMQENEALEAAKAALAETYGLTDDSLSSLVVQVQFRVSDPERPVWVVHFSHDAASEDEEAYEVTLDAATGEVVSAEYFETMNG